MDELRCQVPLSHHGGLESVLEMWAIPYSDLSVL